jgi:hypothetical protein
MSLVFLDTTLWCGDKRLVLGLALQLMSGVHIFVRC